MDKTKKALNCVDRRFYKRTLH